MAYPVDSVYFPFRTQLQAQIDRAKARNWYIGVHFLTGNYYSAGRERRELAAQLEALASYGLTDLKGVNQHTWRSSCLEEDQTLRDIWNAGLLWESGYEPGGAFDQFPHTSAETVIGLPFFLMNGEERTLLVQNCSVLLYRDSSWTDRHGKYGMPVLAYYHCDMIYKDDSDARDAVQTLNAFRDKFHYNFVKEDQLMYATAAAYNLAVDVSVAGDGLTLTPRAISTDFPLYQTLAQNACGVKVELSESLQGNLTTDAAVWYEQDGSLFLGLDRPVTLAVGVPGQSPHLRQVNIPAQIETSDTGATLTFLEGGLMECAVTGKAATDDPDWTITRQDGLTIFRKIGGEDTLHIQFG